MDLELFFSEEWREDLKRGSKVVSGTAKINEEKETAQVERFQLFLGHRLTYISMTVRFHCQISDCDTQSVLVTDILVGQCNQHSWTWIGWWFFFDPVSIMERERGSFKDGAMKLKLYVLSTAFDQSPVNSLSCSTVLVRALNCPV